MIDKTVLTYYDNGRYMGSYIRNPEHIDYTPVPGAEIYDVARAALIFSVRHRISVNFVFNGVKMNVPWPSTYKNVSSIIKEYCDKIDQNKSR